MIREELRSRAGAAADEWHAINGDEVGDRDAAYGPDELDAAYIAGYLAGHDAALGDASDALVALRALYADLREARG